MPRRRRLGPAVYGGPAGLGIEIGSLVLLRFGPRDIEVDASCTLFPAVFVESVERHDLFANVVLNRFIVQADAILRAKNLHYFDSRSPALATRRIAALRRISDRELDNDAVTALLPADKRARF